VTWHCSNETRGVSRTHVRDTDDLISELYIANYEMLVRVASLLLDEPAACEDVVQEAYIRAWSRQARLRDPAKALAYLRQTVVNLSRSALRRRVVAARPRLGPRLVDRSADDATIQRFAEQAAVKALARLPRRQREVVVLRYFAGLSEAETADALGLSVGSVKGYGSRGLSRLAVWMEDWR
jgi:RNA polymerase sigma-70 factor (sigma-E family)